MLVTIGGRNAALDALALNRVDLCTGFPGQTNANVVTGGTYAQQPITFGVASAGVRTSTIAPVFAGLPAPVTISWVSFLKQAGNVPEAVSPNGAAPKEFQVSSLVANSVYAAAHGYAAGQKIVFYGGAPPSTLTEGFTYVVCTAGGAGYTTDNFQVALPSTPATPIPIGSTQAATSCVVSVIVEESFSAPGGTFTLQTGATVSLNF